jgi:hypothetical protein
MTMNPRVKVLKQLVADEHYVVDDTALAEAMILRALALRMLPDVTFRSMPCREPEVRSFRPHRGAKSFRLSRAERRPLHLRSADRTPVA